MSQNSPEPPSPPQPPPEPTWWEALALPLGLLGAILGGVLGGWVFLYLFRQGMYAPFLVEGFSAFVAIGLARRGGWALAVPVALMALVAGLVAHCLALRGDMTEFGAFLQRLTPVMWAFHGLGTVLAAVIVVLTPPRPR